MRRGALCGLLCGLLLGTPALAAAPREVRAAVERILSGYEPVDPGEPLRRLGPAAAEALLELAQEEGQPLMRLRAIEALGHVPTPAGLAYLLGLVQRHRGATDPVSVYELAAAARALGGFAVQGEAPLLPLLGHESADVREGAAAGLRRVGGTAALRALRAQQARERERGVRAALTREIARLEESVRAAPVRTSPAPR